MDYLSNVMLDVLKFFYAIGGQNYGLSIIWLTIAVNLALYPLTLISIKQMAAMQKVQPRMKELQKKYKDEPTKLQQEIMALYKSEKVNPLGGCLPVLLKIPFFLALFFALQSKEFLAIAASSQFLWMTNIVKPDPTYIMIVLIGLSTWLSQKSMPTSPDQNQMMLIIMPFFIAFISISFPAGVQIYWVISNLMGWVQQEYILRKKVNA
ncbi:MAG: YidC/Oxa1 family membrane protein insertase [Candidatus Margulisiibacteriota bacterium]